MINAQQIAHILVEKEDQDVSMHQRWDAGHLNCKETKEQLNDAEDD